MWQEKLKIYDALVAKCPRFERLGKTMPYTAANGYMFSLFNKAGEIGIRFSKDRQQHYFEELQTTFYESYGAVMNDYIVIPEAMLSDLDKIAVLLDESYDYIMSLEPNKHKKK